MPCKTPARPAALNLDDLLADPMIRAMMARDRVSEDDMRDVMRAGRVVLR